MVIVREARSFLSKLRGPRVGAVLAVTGLLHPWLSWLNADETRLMRLEKAKESRAMAL